jgi:hypothetical protein
MFGFFVAQEGVHQGEQVAIFWSSSTVRALVPFSILL